MSDLSRSEITTALHYYCSRREHLADYLRQIDSETNWKNNEVVQKIENYIHGQKLQTIEEVRCAATEAEETIEQPYDLPSAKLWFLNNQPQCGFCQEQGDVEDAIELLQSALDNPTLGQRGDDNADERPMKEVSVRAQSERKQPDKAKQAEPVSARFLTLRQNIRRSRCQYLEFCEEVLAAAAGIVREGKVRADLMSDNISKIAEVGSTEYGSSQETLKQQEEFGVSSADLDLTSRSLDGVLGQIREEIQRVKQATEQVTGDGNAAESGSDDAAKNSTEATQAIGNE